VEEWLNRHWVPAALSSAILLASLLPVLALRWSAPWLLIYSLLPAYMFHQVEEHTGDRFREFVNRRLFDGTEALTHATVLWINLPGVWGVGLLSIYAASFGGPRWGLSLAYLTLVNAVLHIVAAIGWGEYNPGLWTALALFVPLSATALALVIKESGFHWIEHETGIAVGLGIHVAIVVYTRSRARRLQSLA
jgi:Protein of unknown function with HXXEE motif